MNTRRVNRPLQCAQKGFTLVELMVTVALVAIVTSIAIPSWSSLIASNRIRSAVNDWTQSFYFARSEAVRQKISITICASSNGTTCTDSSYEMGWIVKTGLSTDDNGVILQDTLPQRGVTLTPTATTARAITISPNGLPISSFAGASVTAQEYPVKNTSITKQIIIARTGRIKIY